MTFHDSVNHVAKSGNLAAPATSIICMIPGPVEMFPETSSALMSGAISHNDPRFAASFQRTLRYMRPLFGVQSMDYQPLVISGGGVMGWDFIGNNLFSSQDPSQRALVVSTGLFGNRFAECLESYDIQVSRLSLDFGQGFHSHPEFVNKLKEMLKNANPPFRLVTLTQVETSTAICTPIAKLVSIIRENSPASLIAVDGVCSIGGVTLRAEEWGIDVAFTAPQKCLASIPGLCLMMLSPKALRLSAEEARKRPPAYYFDWSRWIPIMKAYESGQRAYFSTPATHAILALEASLQAILGPIQSSYEEMTERLALYAQSHEKSWRLIQSVLKDELGLKMVCLDERDASTTVSAWYVPTRGDSRAASPSPPSCPSCPSANSCPPSPTSSAPTATEWIAAMRERGVVIAAGVHADYGSKYIRIGHMGPSATMPSLKHVGKLLDAMRCAYAKLGQGTNCQ